MATSEHIVWLKTNHFIFRILYYLKSIYICSPQPRIMDLISTGQNYWETLDSLDWWAKLAVGIFASIIVAGLVRLIAHGPVLKLIKKTSAKYDDVMFELAIPLINSGIILLGIWLTLIWALEDSSTNEMVFSTLIIVILLFLVGRFLSETVDFFIPVGVENLNRRADVDLTRMESLLSTVLKVAIWASAVMVIMSQLNIDVTGFLASATIISLVVGMALQETASNLVSGLLMVTDKPFEQGDKITIMGVTGTVMDIGIMSTKILTVQDHLVIIPNNVISSKEVTNFAKGGTPGSPKSVNLRLDIEVGYNEQPAHVKQMLLDITRECDYVMSEPQPTALFMNMLGSSLQFRLNCWVEDYADEWVARDWLLTNILQTCSDQGIEIPYPHMQLKYDPELVVGQSPKGKTSETNNKAAEKEKAQAEARVKDEAESMARMKERKETRNKIEELRNELNSIEQKEELTEVDEERKQSIMSDVSELEQHLLQGGGSD